MNYSIDVRIGSEWIIFVNPSYLRKPAGRLGKVSPCEQSENLEGEGGAPKWPQKCIPAW